MVLALSQADAALSELSGVGRHLPNPHLLIAPYIRREAVLSSRIEGTRTGMNELWLEDVGAEGRCVENADVQEVRNYIQALEYGIQRLADLPLSLRLVREVHARLMQGVRGKHKQPGEFRPAHAFSVGVDNGYLINRVQQRRHLCQRYLRPHHLLPRAASHPVLRADPQPAIRGGGVDQHDVNRLC
mgnify:CR=1 FL=1